jgi:molecular chaperone HscA
MALLQISEPGESPDPHQRKLAVGIDLGTTNSLVATVRHAVPEVLPDLHGKVLLPSVVNYRASAAPLVGTAAMAKQIDDPRNTIASVKRLMGRGTADVRLPDGLRYQLDPQPGMVRIKTAAGLKTPVEVSADILSELRHRAEQSLGGELSGAVITVPAYFDEAQRQATKDAAKLAGIDVLRLLNEPTAAAVAYGLDQGKRGVFAIYDLGGGTFDISVLRLTDGVFEVLATGGDSALGGDDFDQVIARWALAQAGQPTQSDEQARALLMHARSAKEALSQHSSAKVIVSFDQQQITLELSQAQFGQMVGDLIKRTTTSCKKTLRDAGLTTDQCDGVVLVGGSTRMPLVRDAVAQFFKREPFCTIDPDLVVAMGAAMQANALVGNAPNGQEWLLLDVIPLSLGIETYGGIAEKIIPRNSTLPVSRAQEFTTFKDGQTALSIHAVQGERELIADCRSLARFELRGIPPMAAGAARIRVTFQVDADGLLSVLAEETTSGVKSSISVKPSYGLADDDIARMLNDSFRAAGQDMQARALAEQRVDAQRLLEATRSALKVDGDLLEAEHRQHVEGALAQLENLIQNTQDHLAIKHKTEQVALLTEPFAAMRMDLAVKRALAGKRIDDLH